MMTDAQQIADLKANLKTVRRVLSEIIDLSLQHNDLTKADRYKALLTEIGERAGAALKGKLSP